MINLFVLFLLMVALFALVGYLRGWQKEVITLSGLIAVIALLQIFGYNIVSLFGAVPEEGMTPEQLEGARRSQVFIQTGIFVIIAFFSYQIVARFLDAASRGRIGDRLRSGLERRVLGMMFGTINGYLTIGGLWSFLEYVPTPEGYEQIPVGAGYPFDPNLIVRPLIDTAAFTFTQYLPLGLFSPTLWLLLFFVAFFIVIIALI